MRFVKNPAALTKEWLNEDTVINEATIGAAE
jgi:hypothetical protein